jgi:hypothetical protein
MFLQDSNSIENRLLDCYNEAVERMWRDQIEKGTLDMFR